MTTRQGEQVLSECGIELMRIMAADEQKSWMLVHDDVCMGGLIMVLSNGDLSIVSSALETILKLAEWPNLRISLKNFIGMKDQLLELMSGSSPSNKEVASRIYTLLFSNQLNETSHGISMNETVSVAESGQQDGGRRRRRNSFFVGGAVKAKTVILQIRGLVDKDDMEICRSRLLTVTGVISITFNFCMKRAIVRVKSDLRPESLSKAIAQTMTMSADQVIKNEDGTETLIPLYVPVVSELPVADMPDYPSDVDSPVTGNQNIARREALDSGSWSVFKSIGNFISNSFYW